MMGSPSMSPSVTAMNTFSREPRISSACARTRRRTCRKKTRGWLKEALRGTGSISGADWLMGSLLGWPESACYVFVVCHNDAMLNALGPPLFIIVVIAVVGWFALATQRNVRKGNDALRWLQDGLKLLGEKTNLRWLGSSVVELTIPSAKEPFRQAEVVVVLEPRDVPFLWWYDRVRGRRDLLIVRGQLRRTPGFEFEALDPRCWTTHTIEKQVRSRNWTRSRCPNRRRWWPTPRRLSPPPSTYSRPLL